MTAFKVTIQAEGCYDFMRPTEKSIPVRIEWDGNTLRHHFSPDEYQVEDLRGYDWVGLSSLVISEIERAWISDNKKKKLAEELDALLGDDDFYDKVIEAWEDYTVTQTVSKIKQLRSNLTDRAADAVRELIDW